MNGQLPLISFPAPARFGLCESLLLLMMVLPRCQEREHCTICDSFEWRMPKRPRFWTGNRTRTILSSSTTVLMFMPRPNMTALSLLAFFRANCTRQLRRRHRRQFPLPFHAGLIRYRSRMLSLCFRLAGSCRTTANPGLEQPGGSKGPPLCFRVNPVTSVAQPRISQPTRTTVREFQPSATGC